MIGAIFSDVSGSIAEPYSGSSAEFAAKTRICLEPKISKGVKAFGAWKLSSAFDDNMALSTLTTKSKERKWQSKQKS